VPTHLVDRQRELTLLQAQATNPPSLVIMRGRRRVGKSFLLQAAFPDDARVISFQADEQPEPAQLTLLAQEASRLVGAPLAFPDWYAALDFFAVQARAGGALVVILDEFQYLGAKQPALPSMIQRRWDEWDREQLPLTFILSGSALSYMEGLFQSGSPTFGRSALRPLILPLSFRDTATFAPTDTSPASLIARFGVVGGTPQYQIWAGKHTLPRVIREAILEPGARLYEEPLHLLRGEETIRDPGPYFTVLAAIAGGRTRTGEISGRLGKTAGRATQLLETLRELGYIEAFEPLEPRHTASARSIWRIKDPFFRFWFRFVFPNRSRLERLRIDEVATKIDADLNTHLGGVFEDCCRDWIGSHSPLGSSADEVGSWWSRDHQVEIDVVALDKKGYTLLGSCKWSLRQIGENILDELYDHRASLGKQAAQAELALFSRSGFTHALQVRATREDVHLIHVVDLFAASSTGSHS
jgi:AAA+ ATPase superfamily predicted ATPase